MHSSPSCGACFTPGTPPPSKAKKQFNKNTKYATNIHQLLFFPFNWKGAGGEGTGNTSSQYNNRWGTWWRSWSRHWATIWKVAGSIPDGVVGFLSFTQSFRPHYGAGVGSATNRNEYQEYFLSGKGSRYIGLTTLPPSCADCLEIWEPQPPGTLLACPGLYWDCFTFTFMEILL